MRLRHTILVALLLVVGTTSFSVKNAIGQTRLGLHVTQEELNVWKQRAASGPYRATGDVKSNSPGDWDKITANANSFLGNSSAQRWAGYTGAGCVPTDTSLGGILPNNGSWLQDAAFYYLVTGTLSYRTAVINELVAQAGVAGVNWANTAKWCIVAEDADNYFRPALWVTQLIYAWDYILAGDQVYGQTVAAGSRTTIETWFLNAATMFQADVAAYYASYIVNRDGSSWDNYTLTGDGTTRCNQDDVATWFGGTVMKLHSMSWNNRVLARVMPTAMVGIQQNNASFKASAIRIFKEIIAYGVYPDNTPSEFERWASDGDHPGYPLVYGYTMYGLMAQIADAFGRLGDTSLLDFSTLVGACGTAGGPKSLQGVLTQLSKHVDHTYLHYSGFAQDANHLFDTIDEVNGNNNIVLDQVMSQANLRYNDAYLKSVYMRTVAGKNGYTTPGYPASPSTGSYYPWGGSWGIEPGTLFMFGQMEGKVSPYGGTTSSQLPAAPSNLVTNLPLP